MANLIAYIPVINRQYLEWIGSHVDEELHLVEQELAESLLPRLSRNVVSLPVDTARVLIKAVFPRMRVSSGYNPSPLNLADPKNFIMPDEDLSRLLAEKYLYPSGHKVHFEQIWARADMTAVQRREPVVPDMEVSSAEVDLVRMAMAQRIAPQSPDWWRQVAVCVFRGKDHLACSYNSHYPSEYETAIFGDPRVNFDAGDPAGAEVYLSLHAEKGIIAAAARKLLEGTSVYVTTFPCGDCARMLAHCRIKELFFSEGYSILKGLETLQSAGVRVVRVVSPESA